MAFVKKRTTPLTSMEVDEFIKDHLPYRIKILTNVKSYSNPSSIDQHWPSFYESAQIMCRMFIEFLGLGIQYVNGKKEPQLVIDREYYSKDKFNSYEVKIHDLGFNFVELSELKPTAMDILAHAYEAGSRATAHLTWGSPFEPSPQKVIQATEIIKSLLENKIPVLKRAV